MTDAEISRRLALAIGWPKAEQSHAKERALVSETGVLWYVFDYRDPAVIWPIAERFNCFPWRERKSVWYAGDAVCSAETPAKAVALAVIKAHEEKP